MRVIKAMLLFTFSPTKSKQCGNTKGFQWAGLAISLSENVQWSSLNRYDEFCNLHCRLCGDPQYPFLVATLGSKANAKTTIRCQQRVQHILPFTENIICLHISTILVLIYTFGSPAAFKVWFTKARFSPPLFSPSPCFFTPYGGLIDPAVLQLFPQFQRRCKDNDFHTYIH